MKAEFSKPQDKTGKNIQCELCSHFCTLSTEEGQNIGKCRVRKNQDGELISLVGHKIISHNIDPIEKKPLYHFLPNSPIFSIGSMGCNLNCAWCQNSSIAHPKDEIQAQKGQLVSPKVVVDAALRHNCKSIAYTYNEPTVFFELMQESAKLAHTHSIKNVIVSNGFQSPKSLETLTPHIDAANIDLKAFKDTTYQKYCQARLKPVLNTIKTLAKSSVWLEVTTLVVPTVNDDLGELAEIANFIKEEVGQDVPWHLSAFRPERQLKHLPHTDPKTLLQAYEIGKKAGLNHVYIGNIFNKNETRCTHCHELLISRTGYQTQINPNFKQGLCPSCQTAIAGFW